MTERNISQVSEKTASLAQQELQLGFAEAIQAVQPDRNVLANIREEVLVAPDPATVDPDDTLVDVVQSRDYTDEEQHLFDLDNKCSRVKLDAKYFFDPLLSDEQSAALTKAAVGYVNGSVPPLRYMNARQAVLPIKWLREGLWLRDSLHTFMPAEEGAAYPLLTRVAEVFRYDILDDQWDWLQEDPRKLVGDLPAHIDRITKCKSFDELKLVIQRIDAYSDIVGMNSDTFLRRPNDPLFMYYHANRASEEPEEQRAFKIHLMPKPEDMPAVVQKLADFANKSPNFKDRILAFKALVYPQLDDVQYPLPEVVIYTHGSEDEVTQTLADVLQLFDDQPGRGTEPRHNIPAGKGNLVFIAQGHGRSKILSQMYNRGTEGQYYIGEEGEEDYAEDYLPRYNLAIHRDDEALAMRIIANAQK